MQQKSGVLIVDADLLGTARIESAAGRAGRSVTTIASSTLDEDTTSEAALVIVDLDRGRETALDALDAARASGYLDARVVAFVSHVDAGLAEDARRRGYETLARGRFWRSLEDLVRA